jgi:hypothetical protein
VGEEEQAQAVQVVCAMCWSTAGGLLPCHWGVCWEAVHLSWDIDIRGHTLRRQVLKQVFCNEQQLRMMMAAAHRGTRCNHALQQQGSITT